TTRPLSLLVNDLSSRTTSLRLALLHYQFTTRPLSLLVNDLSSRTTSLRLALFPY
ncbi:predicted protein, partial [Nematostella vectensis]